MRIRKATLTDYNNITSLIDNEFTKEGFGFVNRAQIETEIRKNRVIVAVEDDEIIGCRIGIGTIWNIVVGKSSRGNGVGRALVDYIRPHTIRVKSDPVGHLSKKQREEFTEPTEFYEKLGFKFWGRSFPRNFWQRGKDGKGQFHAIGKIPHIKIYKDPTMIMDIFSTPTHKGGTAE